MLQEYIENLNKEVKEAGIKAKENGTEGLIPEKLSDFVRLAISDAKRLDRNKYMPTYTNWVSREIDEKIAIWEELRFNAENRGIEEYDENDFLNNEAPFCLVCFAGSVMVGSMGVECEEGVSVDATSNNFGEKVACALVALDRLRDGLGRSAWKEWCIFLGKDVDKSEMPDWCMNIRGMIKHGDFTGWEEYEKFLVEMENVANVIAMDGW